MFIYTEFIKYFMQLIEFLGDVEVILIEFRFSKVNVIGFSYLLSSYLNFQIKINSRITSIKRKVIDIHNSEKEKVLQGVEV